MFRSFLLSTVAAGTLLVAGPALADTKGIKFGLGNNYASNSWR